MFRSFRTDRCRQTVQTQIILLRVYTVCNSLFIFWMHNSKETPSCSTFRVITIHFRVSEILGFLRYSSCRSLIGGQTIVRNKVRPGRHSVWDFIFMKLPLFTFFADFDTLEWIWTQSVPKNVPFHSTLDAAAYPSNIWASWENRIIDLA